MEIVAQKANQRILFRERLRRRTAAEHAQSAAAVAARVLSLPEVVEAQTILAYWPLLTQGELDTRPLIDTLQAAQKQIVLPVVVNYSRAPSPLPRMRLARYTGRDQLRSNRWGIHEPVDGETVPAAALDALLVPALGAARSGVRLGHGYGYYDELLAQVKAPTICLTFADCLVDTLPAALHDQRVAVIVTEEEILRFPAPPEPAAGP